jgi:hypothetical protein
VTELARTHRAVTKAQPVGCSLPSDDANNPDNGELALKLAGQALDPDAPYGPSLALGQRLLREAFISATRTLCGDPQIDSVEAAARSLARRDEPGSSGRPERRRAELVAALEPLSVPDHAALTKAELEVARLLDEATGRRRVARAERRALWALAGLIVAVTSLLIFANRRLHPQWENYHWTASSALPGFALSGTLGEHDWTYDLVFHTLEENSPWVVVDLLSTRSIEDVTVVNRSDCCSERGLPLALELAGEDGKFVEIGTRTSPFETWRVTFRPQTARYVRLRAKSRTILHFRDVQIR